MGQENPSQNRHYVEANGLNIYYEEAGSGEPLILIHGGLSISTTLYLLIW